MPSTFWNTDDLSQVSADAAIKKITDAADAFKAQYAQPVVAAMPTFKMPDLSSLTPWAPGTDTSGGVSAGGSGTSGAASATPSLTAQPAPASSFDLASFTPWAPKDTSSVEPSGPSATQSSAVSSSPTGGRSPVGAQPSVMPTGQSQPGSPIPDATLPDHLDTSSRDANLAQWAPALQAVQAKTGLRADALGAIIQAENGGGQSPLSAQGNNYFSISAVDSPYQIGADDATPGYGLPGRFGRYKTPQASLDHFIDLVSTSPRYADAWANRADPQKFFEGLVKGGYIVPESGFPVETWLQNLDAGRQHYNEIAPQPAPSGAATAQPSTMPSTASQAVSSTYTQQGLADAGDPDAWAKCGPVAAYQFALRTGRNPTPSEVEKLAKDAGWTPSAGMAGFQSEAKVLAGLNIPAKAEDGVDWNKVIIDVSRGNPVLLQLPGNEGHYITAQGYDPQTGKIDFGSTVGDLRAAKHQTQFTPSELENLGWGIPTASLYLDNPATPSPSVVANPPSPQMNRLSLQSGAGGDQWPQTSTSAESQNGGTTSSDVKMPPTTLLRQPLQATSGPDSTPTFQDSQTAAASQSSSGVDQPPSSLRDSATSSLPTDASSGVDASAAPAPGPTPPAGAGAFQDDQTQNGYQQPAATSAQQIPNEDQTSQPPAPSEQPSLGTRVAAAAKPVWDAAGTVLGYLHDEASGAASALQGAAPTVADQARGITSTGQTPLDAAGQAIGAGVSEAMAPGASLLDQVSPGGNADTNDLTGVPEPYRSNLLAARRAGFQMVTLALPSAVAEHLWSAAGLPVANIAGYEINPGAFLVPVPTGAGGVLENRATQGLTAGLANRIPDVAGALENVIPRVSSAARSAISSGIDRIGSGLSENASRVVALDAERAASGQGSTVAAGGFGDFMRENIDPMAQKAAEDARAAEAARQAAQPPANTEEQLARSEYGRRWEETPPQIQGPQTREYVGNAAGSSAYPSGSLSAEAAAQLSPPARQYPNLEDRANATAGILPEASPTDRLARVNRILAQGATSAISGGVGAVTEQQLGDQNDPNRALKGFVAGAAIPALATRGAAALARRFGREIPEAEGALASIGHVPGKQLPNVSATPQQVAAESAKGAQRGEILNREVAPPGSQVPRAVRAATKITDPLAATRWAEDLLTDVTGNPRLAENSPERASTQLRVNPTGLIKDRIDRELAPVVTEAVKTGLHNELPQYVSDVHERDILDEFYHRGYTASMDASLAKISTATANNMPANAIARLQAKAQADAAKAGDLAMNTRAGSNPEFSYATIDARIKAQEDRLDQAGKLDDLQRLASGVWDTAKQSLQNAVDAGRVEPQVAQDLAATYPHYVPTVPISKLDPGGRSFGANGGGSTLVSASKTGPIHALEDVGSGSERLNPIVAIRNQIVSGERANQQNRVFLAFAKLYDDAQQSGAAIAQGNTGKHTDVWNGERDLTGLVDGKPTSIRVPAPVADGIQSMVSAGMGADDAVNAYKRVVRWFSSQLTAGRASYAPLNLARDANDTFFNAMAKGGGIKALPGIMGPWMDEAGKAVLDVARAQANPRSIIGSGVGAAYGASLGDENTTPGQRVQHAIAGGLASSVVLGANKDVPISSSAARAFELRGGAESGLSAGWQVGQRWYRDVVRDGGAAIKTPADLARYLGDWGLDILNLQGSKGINERLDMVGRTAAMRNAEATGAGPTEAMIAGRDSSYDPQRAGTVMRAVNGVVPFTNATVQGAAQFARALRDHPLGTLATVTTTLAPAMLAVEAWNRSDPERAQIYDNVPQYLKDSGIVVVPGLGSGSDNRGTLPKYLWIPTEIVTPFVVAMRAAMQHMDSVVPGMQSAAGRSDINPDAGPVAQWGGVLNEALQIFNPVHGDTASAIGSNLVPPLAKQAIELGLNKDLYRGNTIVSPAADERASTLSRGISKATNAVGRVASTAGMTGVGDLLQNAHPSGVEHLLQAAPAYNDIAGGISDQVAPGPYKQSEQGRVANEPFVGGIAARFIRDASGANLERVQSASATQNVRAVLQAANMHPADVSLTVPADYKGAPLTRTEMVRWQKSFNAELNFSIRDAQDDPKWDDLTTRQEAVKTAVSKAMSRSAQDALSLSDSDIRDRVDKETVIKRKLATSAR